MVNAGAAMDVDEQAAGLGVMARDADGMVMGGRATRVLFNFRGSFFCSIL